jgi:hypothetical protein
MRKRSRKQEPDINQIAFRIVKNSTGEPDLSDDDARRALAQALGRLGGLKGGKARAAKMSKAERRESASKAAKARWSNKSDKSNP